MADLVERVLREESDKQAKYKSIEVHKDIDLEIDEGNLLAVDTNPFDIKKFKSNREKCLKEVARDNTQLLINRIWQLPTERVEDAVVAKLPDAKTLIPREKRVPKARAPTKWEEYARMKGIHNKKKGRMTWDEQTKSWKPVWGYNRANDDTKDWLIEVPDNADPMEDQFEKRMTNKKERIAKNELQRLRNIARAQKSKVPGVGLTPTETPSEDHIGKALAMAKKSTASIGKFTGTLPKEKPSKFTGKKRKFEPNHGSIKNETSKQLQILSNLNNQIPVVNVTQAVNSHMIQEEKQRSKRKREDGEGGSKPKRGKGGKKHGGKRQGGIGGKVQFKAGRGKGKKKR